MMNARYQLPAPVALCIIGVISLTTGVLLVRAIDSADFSSVNASAASVAH